MSAPAPVRLLLRAACLGVLLAPVVGRAEDPPTALRLQVDCAGSGPVSISGSDAAGDRVEVSGSVAQVSREGGAFLVRTACDDAGPVAIRMPRGLAVTVTSDQSVPVSLTGVEGPVSLTLSDSASVAADRLSGALELHASESRLAVGALDGAATLVGTDGASVSIGRIDSPSVSIRSSDGSRFGIGDGTIEHLSARAEDGSRIAVAARIGDGLALSSDGSAIDLARVTGRLDRSTDDDGTIRVGGDAGRSAAAAGSIGDEIAAAREEGRRAVEEGRQAAEQGRRMAEAARAGGRRAAEGGQGTADAGRGSDRRGRDADLTPVLVLVAVAAIGFLALYAGRAGALRGLLPARRGAAPGPAARPPADPALASLLATIDGLARRTGRIEHYVTSREFELHREFRDIGDD